MTTSIDHSRTIAALMRGLRAAGNVEPFAERDSLDELLYSFLLWEAPRAKAEPAFKRLNASIADYNELRVTRPEEIADTLGKTYPRALERSERLGATLGEIYIREYAVTLEPCAGMNKREARKYLETLEGLPPFVAARVTLRCFNGHAVPVDDRLLSRLIAAEAIDPDTDESGAGGILERHLKAGEGLDAHTLFQAWADGEIEPRQSGRSRSTRKSGARSAGRSTAASRSNARR